MSPRARREGRQLFPITILHPPLPHLPTNLSALSKLRATSHPRCHSCLPTSHLLHQLETSTPGSLPLYSHSCHHMSRTDTMQTISPSVMPLVYPLSGIPLLLFLGDPNSQATPWLSQQKSYLSQNSKFTYLIFQCPFPPFCSHALASSLLKSLSNALTLSQSHNPFLSPFVSFFVELRLYGLWIIIPLQYTLLPLSFSLHHTCLANSSASWPQVSMSSEHKPNWQ